MKYVDEFRDPERVSRLSARIRRAVTRPWTLMEVCGGQTHTIVRFGLEQLLPEEIRMVHGPGCPVCVTPIATLERAISIARRPGVIFTSFGDMLRVPCGSGDLQSARAAGADVRVVYSPLDAVEIARNEPDREVVFFAVGFETTAPANATALLAAQHAGLENFSLLVSHVRVPPAMQLVLSSPGCRVQGFLAAGHVCTVMGTAEYHQIVRDFHVPIVVTGFEPLDLLQGIAACVEQLEAGQARVEIGYSRAVRAEGNTGAMRAMEQVFEVVDWPWRGLGTIPRSGLAIREELSRFDAQRRYGMDAVQAAEPTECRAGEVLLGAIRPAECAEFGIACTPERPLGAPMVSNEGACAAYYRYRGAAR